MVTSPRLPEHEREFTLKDGTEIVSGLLNGHDVMIVDDSDTNCWIAMWEHGVLAIIMSASFEDAYQSLIDAMDPIPNEDLEDAFAAYDDPEYTGDFDAWIAAKEDAGIYPELVQGYEYQANGHGTCIVDVGHCLHLRRMTVSDARSLHVQIQNYWR